MAKDAKEFPQTQQLFAYSLRFIAFFAITALHCVLCVSVLCLPFNSELSKTYRKGRQGIAKDAMEFPQTQQLIAVHCVLCVTALCLTFNFELSKTYRKGRQGIAKDAKKFPQTQQLFGSLRCIAFFALLYSALLSILNYRKNMAKCARVSHRRKRFWKPVLVLSATGLMK
jgi:hypothetical protein